MIGCRTMNIVESTPSNIVLSAFLKITRVKKDSNAVYAKGIEKGDIVEIQLKLADVQNGGSKTSVKVNLYKNQEAWPYCSTTLKIVANGFDAVFDYDVLNKEF